MRRHTEFGDPRPLGSLILKVLNLRGAIGTRMETGRGRMRTRPSQCGTCVLHALIDEPPGVVSTPNCPVDNYVPARVPQMYF
eukprot:4573902-Pyramimonas_sp.AAC.1